MPGSPEASTSPGSTPASSRPSATATSSATSGETWHASKSRKSGESRKSEVGSRKSASTNERTGTPNLIRRRVDGKEPKHRVILHRQRVAKTSGDEGG